MRIFCLSTSGASRKSRHQSSYADDSFFMMTIMAVVVDKAIWKSNLLMYLTFDADGEDREAYVALTISHSSAIE